MTEEKVKSLLFIYAPEDDGGIHRIMDSLPDLDVPEHVTFQSVLDSAEITIRQHYDEPGVPKNLTEAVVENLKSELMPFPIENDLFEFEIDVRDWLEKLGSYVDIDEFDDKPLYKN